MTCSHQLNLVSAHYIVQKHLKSPSTCSSSLQPLILPDITASFDTNSQCCSCPHWYCPLWVKVLSDKQTTACSTLLVYKASSRMCVLPLLAILYCTRSPSEPTTVTLTASNATSPPNASPLHFSPLFLQLHY